MDITIKNIERIWLTADAIHIKTLDGSSAKECFADYDELRKANPEERRQYVTSEFGIYWPKFGVELSFEGFFKAKREASAVGALFSKIPEINVSAFARRIGIAQPLMADYISGKKKPSKKQMLKILKGVKVLGKEIQESALS